MRTLLGKGDPGAGEPVKSPLPSFQGGELKTISTSILEIVLNTVVSGLPRACLPCIFRQCLLPSGGCVRDDPNPLPALLGFCQQSVGPVGSPLTCSCKNSLVTDLMDMTVEVSGSTLWKHFISLDKGRLRETVVWMLQYLEWGWGRARDVSYQ